MYMHEYFGQSYKNEYSKDEDPTDRGDEMDRLLTSSEYCTRYI